VTASHVPSDYILDEFLGKHGVKVSIREFGALLTQLRAAFAAEATVDREAAIEAAAKAQYEHDYLSDNGLWELANEVVREAHRADVEIPVDAVLALLNGSES
jgi:hypothetical protein